MADSTRPSSAKRYASAPLPFPATINWTPPFLLESKQLRVVVLREHKVRGKHVVFDSTVWERQQQRKCASNGVPRQSGVKEKINHAANPRRTSIGKSKAGDTDLLAEMMFGSVPFVAKSRGATIKVHKLKDQSRLLFTKIFTIQPIINGRSSAASESGISSASTTHSLPILTPKPEQNQSDWSLPNSPLDIFRPGSSFTSNTSAGSFQASSPGSLHLRRVKSFVTSFEYRQSVDEGIASPEVQKCTKLAIGVVVVLPAGELDEAKLKRRYFEDFFFSHFPLLESHIERLKTQIESLLQNSSKNVQEIIAEHISLFKSTLVNLANTMRLGCPYWSCLVASKSVSRPVASQQFVGLLRNALQLFNKQSQNFFMTRLLSATLQYHLGWVSTVSPAEENPTQAFLNKHFSHSLSSLAQSHPYNPFWAQLADLYGSVGSPCHFARTVLVGRKASIVYQLLYVLSYFIRCSDVSETNYELESLLANWRPERKDDEEEKPELSSSIPVCDLKATSDVDKTESLDSGFCNEDPGKEKPKGGLHTSILEHDMAQDQHLEDKFGELESTPLVYLEPVQKESRSEEINDVKSLSMSLFGGFVPEYLPNFVLHGTAEPLDEFIMRLQQDFRAQIQHPCVEEMIDEAVCIVADTDQWTCDVVSLANKRADYRRQNSEPLLQIRRATCSAFVHRMLQMQLDFQARGMPEEFCLTALEDGLQEIYYKSKILSEHHRMSGGTPESDHQKQAAMAGADKTDLPLLFSVASTHCPYIPPQLDSLITM